MTATVFNQRVKHGRLDFHPDVRYGFEDPDATPYFVAAGWAAEVEGDPVVVIGLDEINIDPLTTFGNGPNRGAPVLPELAAAAAVEA